MPSLNLQERVLRQIRRERLIPPNARVLAALSGGADSVALTLLLRELAGEAGFALAGVAHLNHRLREAADADEHFCRELAASLALPIDVERVDVGLAARRGRISIEDAGTPGAVRVLRPRRRPAGGGPGRNGTPPGRSGRDLSHAADPRRRSGWPGRHQAARGLRGPTSAARFPV